MKTIFTFILILYFSFSFGQQVKFNEEMVDTIYIESNVSAYQFDDKGTTKGKTETLIIAYNKLETQYVIFDYVQDKYEITYKPDSVYVKTKKHKKEVGKIIEKSTIESLLNALSKNDNPLNFLNNIDSIEFEKIVTEKQIRKIAKNYNIDWQFKMRYSTKEENEEFFKTCQSLDTFSIYLQERFDSTGYVMITDYSNTIDIKILTKNSKFRFEGKYPNPLKQPWYNHSDNEIELLGRATLNLKINIELEKILPDKFLLKGSISKNAIAKDYLDWYFDRKGMK